MPRAFNSLARSVAVIVLTALAAALLVRLAPGYGLDARLTDATLGSETRAQIGAQAQAATSRWGTSTAFDQPVASLIARRWQATAFAVGTGWLAAWLAAFAVISISYTARSSALWTLADGSAALLVCAPVAILALAAFVYRLPVASVIAAAIFPMIYRFLRDRIQAAQGQWAPLGAEARGLARWRVALVYVLAPARAELAMLGAVSLKWAVSAAIPAEVFSDAPGLGQLVWKAAEARDLALIVPLTLLVATFVQTAQAAASLVAQRRAA
jgi:ABC-type dipeptide/oligopeptide/nickel transport system permease component